MNALEIVRFYYIVKIFIIIVGILCIKLHEFTKF